jgi:hypothetical protein
MSLPAIDYAGSVSHTKTPPQPYRDKPIETMMLYQTLVDKAKALCMWRLIELDVSPDTTRFHMATAHAFASLYLSNIEI